MNSLGLAFVFRMKADLMRNTDACSHPYRSILLWLGQAAQACIMSAPRAAACVLLPIQVPPPTPSPCQSFRTSASGPELGAECFFEGIPEFF